LAGVDYSEYSVNIPYECQNLLLISFKRGINIKASPTLIKSQFYLEGSTLAALEELELGESMDRISHVKTHCIRFDVPELLPLLAYT